MQKIQGRGQQPAALTTFYVACYMMQKLANVRRAKIFRHCRIHTYKHTHLHIRENYYKKNILMK
jgi:archaellum component FlaF (FlaF/FlaG flagellin family)